jgi:hypothetical protein
MLGASAAPLSDTARAFRGPIGEGIVAALAELMTAHGQRRARGDLPEPF